MSGVTVKPSAAVASAASWRCVSFQASGPRPASHSVRRAFSAARSVTRAMAQIPTSASGFASVGAEAVPAKLLVAKLALVLLCLARGLLDFIWSIRQLNYALALIGAAPEVHTEADRAALGDATADLLNPALNAFSQGVRGYYFALAAAAWLFGPLWLALGVAAAFWLMVWRQAGSPAARAIRSARRLLERT